MKLRATPVSKPVRRCLDFDRQFGRGRRIRRLSKKKTPSIQLHRSMCHSQTVLAWGMHYSLSRLIRLLKSKINLRCLGEYDAF